MGRMPVQESSGNFIQEILSRKVFVQNNSSAAATQRSGEDLGPVVADPGGAPELGETVTQDVGLVAAAVHPGAHDLGDTGLAGGDVFAGGLPDVPDRPDALASGRRCAREEGSADCRRQILGQGEGGYIDPRSPDNEYFYASCEAPLLGARIYPRAA